LKRSLLPLHYPLAHGALGILFWSFLVGPVEPINWSAQS